MIASQGSEELETFLILFYDRYNNHRFKNHIHLFRADLVIKPVWNAQELALSGTSSVIANEPYRVTIALNGFKPLNAISNHANAKVIARKDGSGLADLVILTESNSDVTWKIIFSITH